MALRRVSEPRDARDRLRQGATVASMQDLSSRLEAIVEDTTQVVAVVVVSMTVADVMLALVVGGAATMDMEVSGVMLDGAAMDMVVDARNITAVFVAAMETVRMGCTEPREDVVLDRVKLQ